MFPNPQHSDALTPQRSVSHAITPSIPLDLGAPEGWIGLRQEAATAWAAMPEASVQEDRDFLPFEVEIRLPEYVAPVPRPTAYTIAGKEGPDVGFGRAVASATNPRHEGGARCLRNGIHGSAGNGLFTNLPLQRASAQGRR